MTVYWSQPRFSCGVAERPANGFTSNYVGQGLGALSILLLSIALVLISTLTVVERWFDGIDRAATGSTGRDAGRRPPAAAHPARLRAAAARSEGHARRGSVLARPRSCSRCGRSCRGGGPCSPRRMDGEAVVAPVGVTPAAFPRSGGFSADTRGGAALHRMTGCSSPPRSSTASSTGGVRAPGAAMDLSRRGASAWPSTSTGSPRPARRRITTTRWRRSRPIETASPRSRSPLGGGSIQPGPVRHDFIEAQGRMAATPVHHLQRAAEGRLRITVKALGDDTAQSNARPAGHARRRRRGPTAVSTVPAAPTARCGSPGASESPRS